MIYEIITPSAWSPSKPDEIVEIHASSGTTGNPIVGAYTRNDLMFGRN